MSDSQKRKQGPGGSRDGPAWKKSKGGTQGRWKTPFHKAKAAEQVQMGKVLDVGDEGIWVTYARGMRPKAVREFKEVCEELAKEMYGITPPGEGEQDKQQNGDDNKGVEKDIATSIDDELNAMKEAQATRSRTRQTFSPVNVGVECVFFMKTLRPVEPGRLARRICEDARDCGDVRRRRTKYVNRLTPVEDTDRSTEAGIEKVARSVMGREFGLVRREGEAEEEGEKEKEEEGLSDGSTYAIRHVIRNNKNLRSDAVIKQIAGLVKPEHKVNLTSPDKVILVEIFQLFCGISVVDGKVWEGLKKYNVNELYRITAEKQGLEGGGEEKAGNGESGKKSEQQEEKEGETTTS